VCAIAADKPSGEIDPVCHLGQQQHAGVACHARAVTGHLHRRAARVPFTFEVPSRSAD